MEFFSPRSKEIIKNGYYYEDFENRILTTALDDEFINKFINVGGRIRKGEKGFYWDESEIIIKCDLEEIAKAFFKDYEIVWHDPNVDSPENQQYMKELEKLCKFYLSIFLVPIEDIKIEIFFSQGVKAFTQWKEAEDYIKTAKTVCHVITSGTNGELLVKEIFSSQNVPKILTFCRSKDYHSIWAKNYEKVLCTETNIEDVILQIQENLLAWHKQTSSLKFDLPAFAPIFDDSDKSQMNHLHHYLKVIPNFSDRARAKKDVIALSRAVYSDKKNEKLIADFEDTYNLYDKETLLRWYTQQSFLYKIVNNCLRIATSDSIQWSRFLLKDIEMAIKEQYKTKSKDFHGLLYRAAYLSEKEWSSLKGNLNREIEMHGFLSVSKDKKVAERFMGVDPAEKVFITIIVPRGPNEEEQGFAEIEEFSKFPKEKEILFNVRSRFTVLETEDEYSKELPSRHLVLLYGAHSLRRYVAEENPVQKISIEDIKSILCSHCQVPADEVHEKLIFMSLRDIEERSYSCKKCLAEKDAPFLCIPLTENRPSITVEVQGCLLTDSNQSKIPFYGYECSKCGVKNQERYFACTDCGEKERRWCQSCFEMSLSCIGSGHAIILESDPFSFWSERMLEAELNHLKYQNDLVKNSDPILQQAEMYFKTHEYEKAIEYYNFYIQHNEADKDRYLATAYSDLGVIYRRQGKYQKALEYSLKSLDLRKSGYGENHHLVAACYDNIGFVYQRQGEYKKAFEYFIKSLDILKSVRGESHPSIATSYNSIGSVYLEFGEYKRALEYHLKSLNISKSIYGENHPNLGTTYNSIGLVYDKQGEYKKALEYYLKGLNMSKLVHGENHPDIAASYSNIGLVYNELGQSKKSLEYNLKALNISKLIYGENHPSMATFYNNIASVYDTQGEYNLALEYHLKSLNIEKAVHEENHPATAGSYNNIAWVYCNQGEYKKALEYYLKSLNIFKSVHGENHPSIATSYSNIGLVYGKQGKFDKALEYHLESLKTQKIVSGESHPDIATYYTNVGLTYAKLEEYKKALEYSLKSLNIFKLFSRENHPHMAASLVNIAFAFFHQGESHKALEYYFKSVDTLKSIHGENNPEIATVYNDIATVYERHGEYNPAIEYYLKSLNINKSVYGENHQKIASSYQNIAGLFSDQGESEKALEYHFKSLDTYKSVYGENHPDTAISYIEIASVYQKQREYNLALEYYLESLNILKSVHGENHPNVAGVYSRIGGLYHAQEDFDKALDYTFKTLEVNKSLHGENHPDIWTAYQNIGCLYSRKGDIFQAIQYHSKARNMQRVVDEESLDIVISSNNNGLVDEKQEECNPALEDSLKSTNVLKPIHGKPHSRAASPLRKVNLVFPYQRKSYKALGDLLKAPEVVNKFLRTFPKSYSREKTSFTKERNL